MGRPIGGELFDDEERRFVDVLIKQEGVVEAGAGGEVVRWVDRDVDFEFDVAGC